jgi:hypothetical protein
MDASDADTQPFGGQRKQQRHTDHAFASGYSTAPAMGSFIMPDAQGSFTFSAEPTSVAYDNVMASHQPSNTPGQDSIFTSNHGSSFDVPLQPDMVSCSYPPPNAHAQGNNYNLSPGSYNNIGHAISPALSATHLSPEAGYIGDPNYQDLSTYTTPSFSGQYLDESFSNLNFTDNTSTTAFPPLQGDVAMPLLNSGTLNTYNAQHQTLPVNSQFASQHQIMSPGTTSNPSAVVGDDGSAFSSMHYMGSSLSSPTPSNHNSQALHPTPLNQTHSPALTSSPGRTSFSHPQVPTRHLTSPIVRVENYSSREVSPARSDRSRSLSKRSHGSRRSGNHLSPYPRDDSSDDDTSYEQTRVQTVFREADRNEDGSWRPNGGLGQAGLNPDDRQAMGNAWVPSIEEMMEHRAKAEKKLEVQEWLTKSEVGSEAGDVPPSNNLLKPFSGRRRAKSHNDASRTGFPGGLGFDIRAAYDRIDDTGIPGPGVYIDERSDYGDYDDDEDDYAEPESPPAAIDVLADDGNGSYFPVTQEPESTTDAIVQPWMDVPTQSLTTSTNHYQPPTSNAAMMRFRLRAKDVESASLAATVGSRRLSEPDLASIRGSPGISNLVEPDLKKNKERQRRPSFLENIRRTPSNLLKRKGSIPVQQVTDTGSDKSREPSLDKPRRIGSWGRPKSPRVDTNLSDKSRDGGSSSSLGLTASSGPWYQGAKNAIKRTRSRSDLGKSKDSGKSLGLAELMTQHGGPPMPMLASPLADTEATKPSAQPSPIGDDDDDDEPEAVTMNLNVRTDPIIPDQEGFRTHARQLNPRLADFMVERIAQEQIRRYKRLLEFKVKHLNVVKSKSCSSANFCTDLGGEAKQLFPRGGTKDSEAPFIGFQITAPGSSGEEGEAAPEGTVVSAQFPTGVPLPPVNRLPAEFECPLCFKVKKFYKPSDWTKHVHEDVQPFTCTFPSCGEPKSFKRKADWVRHENERHRQLENWTCQIGDCTHTCYRKDNFVQHLVREHKIAEPRQRPSRASNKDSLAGSDRGRPYLTAVSRISTDNVIDDIWSIVEQCRKDTDKQPKNEPCRFCGNICNSWKKLTVHLAKHMEQISMPILPLVEQKLLNADSVISPVVEVSEGRKMSAAFGKSPIENPLHYNSNSTFAPGVDPFARYPQEIKSEVASNVMHSYPPPQMMQGHSTGYRNFPGININTQPFPNLTYPGPQEPPKPNNGYPNGLHTPNVAFNNGNIAHGTDSYMTNHVSAVQQQAFFTDSPIETTAFPSYFAPQEPHDMANEAGNTMQYQQQANYQPMSYLANQTNYQY